MREEMKLKISQFMDEELDLEEGLDLLKHLQDNPEAGDVFRRYAVISGVLKNNTMAAADADFVSRISAQIKNEPTVLCPAVPSVRSYTKVITALAASLAAIAVISAGVIYYRDTHVAGQNMQAAEQQSKENQYAEAQPTKDDARFNEYLEAHGATLYTGGNPAGKTFGQVVSYGRK